MSLLSVAKDVCAAVGVAYPTSVFSGISDSRTMQEMLAVANEIAQRVAYDTRDWTRLRAVANHVGDGAVVPPATVMTGTTAFTLPANYKRMLLTSNVWRTNYSHSPMKFISDTDEWLNRRARNSEDGGGEWTLLGGQIHTYPILPAGHTIYYAYVDKNCIELRAPNGAYNGPGDTFLSDTDTYALDERLLKLGMIWEWKSRHGSPYAEDMGTYPDAIMNSMGRDQPAPIIYGRGSHTGADPWPS